MPTPTDYADVFVTAIEGGTGYWAQVEGYEYRFADFRSDPIIPDPALDYARATLIDMETNDRWAIDSRDARWHNAVAKAAEFYGMSVAAFIEDHDAEYADVTMQFATLGELTYS